MGVYKQKSLGQTQVLNQINSTRSCLSLHSVLTCFFCAVDGALVDTAVALLALVRAVADDTTLLAQRTIFGAFMLDRSAPNRAHSCECHCCCGLKLDGVLLS
jgi:hypothetical protein